MKKKTKKNSKIEEDCPCEEETKSSDYELVEKLVSDFSDKVRELEEAQEAAKAVFDLADQLQDALYTYETDHAD